MNPTEQQPLLRGVIPAALTPFDRDLRPDHRALVAHCRWLLAQGCHGVLVLGTTGEANSLSVEERLVLLDALEEAELGPLLMVGTGCCAAPDTVRLTRRAVQMGAGGALVLPPFYYKDVPEDGLFAHFAEVIQQVGDPRLRMYLYNFPRMTGLTLGHGLVARLLSNYPGTVVGMKDSSGDWPAMAAVLEAFPGFSLFSGTEEHLLADLRAGGPGCISATLNLLAPRALRLHAAWRSEEAGELQQELTRLRLLLRGVPMIPALKALMAHRAGRPGWERIRPPLQPLDRRPAQELIATMAREQVIPAGSTSAS